MEKKLICGLILARSGSRDIKNKNIVSVNKKPLIYYTAKQASLVDQLDKVFVLTDSEKYKKIIDKLKLKKVEVIGRSKKSSTDKAQSEIAIKEFLQKYHFNYIVFIQATNVFLKKKDIQTALEIYFSKNFDTLLSVIRSKKFFWKKINNNLISVNYNYKKRKMRQNIKDFFIENGSFYIFSKKGFLKHQNRIHGNIGYYEMNQKSFFDIDNKEQLKIVKKLI